MTMSNKALPREGLALHPDAEKAYATTSIPIDRAVPLMLLIAVSTEAAFKSGIFCVAISRTCCSVTLPTFSLFGVPEPLATPAAAKSSSPSAAGSEIRPWRRDDLCSA